MDPLVSNTTSRPRVAVLADVDLAHSLHAQLAALPYEAVSLGAVPASPPDAALVDPGHGEATAVVQYMARRAIPVLLIQDRATPPMAGTLGAMTPQAACGPGLEWALRYALERGAVARDETSRRLLLAGQVAATVGHELNNALTYVMTNLEYACQTVQSRDEVSDALRESLDETRLGVHRLAGVVRELSRVVRSPAERLEAVHLPTLIQSALAMARVSIQGRASDRTEIRVMHAVTANEERLFQVLLNLILNAAQAIEPGDPDSNEIVVATSWDERRVAIEVRDTGRGIAPENLERVFEPFFTTRSDSTGTGIGLALCRRYIQEMGGEVGISSTVGVGTTVRVVLDVARATLQRPTLVPDLGLGRARVLVIDDEPLIGRAFERALRNDHDVVSVTSAAAAVEALTEGSFDAVFSDVWLGADSGFALHDRIVKRWPQLKGRIAMLTGGPIEGEVLERKELPLFQKPLTVNQLREAVEALLIK